ncbi:MAG: protoporphyrinogen oxidase [Nocardioides sp.]
MTHAQLPASTEVVVIGGGIAGLVAARRLAQSGAGSADSTVTLLEAGNEVGGKLRGVEVAGVRVDSGAEAMLARRPEGIALAEQLGLPLVVPEAVSPSVYSRGALRPLPRSLMGAPTDSASLEASGVLSVAGLSRALREPGVPIRLPAEDVAVGELIAERFGEEVVDRLVEPLLGGVYAGDARRISAQAAVPQLLAALERGPLLDRSTPAPSPSVAATADSVFAGIEGGMWRLPEALAATAGVSVHTQQLVRAIRRVPGGFEVLTSAVGSGVEHRLHARHVVVATPAHAASRLLGEIAPVAAAALAEIEAASVGVVTLALTPESAGDLPGSGFLVPPVEDGVRIKAATFSANKWAWVAAAGRSAGVVLVRASWGRAGEVRSLQRSDEELIAASVGELAGVLRRDLSLVAGHVQRWGGGLPQYAVGHLDRVERIRADVARIPGLAVCGAAYDGVGIPAVIASADRAVRELLGGPGTAPSASRGHN